MPLSPTTFHFWQVNRWVCFAGIAVLVGAVCLSLFFAAGMKTAEDRDALQQVQLVSLPAVRISGHVQPIFIKRIDTDLSALPPAERKQAFIRMLLPLVARENDRIQALRKRLEQGALPATISADYLKPITKDHGVQSGDREHLEQFLDIIPASLVIAQAALESGWGTSRFALEGNNLFGMQTYDDGVPGIAPAGATGFKIIRFGSLGDGVAAYMRNLNTHDAYRALRKARTALRREGKPVSGPALSNWLTRYSEIPQTYGKLLRAIIARENLVPFDNVRIGVDG